MDNNTLAFAANLPPGSVIVTPAEGEDVEVGFGYVGETGQDIVFLVIRDAHKGPHVVLLSPVVAQQVADTMNSRCANLARLRTNQNGDPHE